MWGDCEVSRYGVPAPKEVPGTPRDSTGVVRTRGISLFMKHLCTVYLSYVPCYRRGLQGSAQRHQLGRAGAGIRLRPARLQSHFVCTGTNPEREEGATYFCSVFQAGEMDTQRG